jgi:hypothetical protein
MYLLLISAPMLTVQIAQLAKCIEEAGATLINSGIGWHEVSISLCLCLFIYLSLSISHILNPLYIH